MKAPQIMTTALLPAPRDSLQARCIASALSGLSPATRRVYQARIRSFLTWLDSGPLDREHVKKYMQALEIQSASPQVRNGVLAAIKRLTSEAGELGWIDIQTAIQVKAIKSKRITGIRTGRWLNASQTAQLLASCDRTTLRGRRDAVVLALLIGCGLRRAEICDISDIQVIRHNATNKLLLMNLIGKGGKVRSVSVPDWAAQWIEEWIREVKEITK